MSQGYNAYAQVAKTGLPPRELEASLLMKAASQLQHAYDNWEDAKASLPKFLTFNRDLWIVLVDSATANDNPLPQEIKNNIASLAVFIFNRTVEVEAVPRKELLSALISINKNIAAGLLGNSGIPAVAGAAE